MDTPLDKLPRAIYDTVYEPSEDSFLLIDALELEIDEIRESKPTICLEIGSGSGVVITALAMALRSQACQFIAIDLNADACSATKQMSCNNGVDVEVIRMDLNSALVPRPMFDVIVFNPPYVVTDSLEVSSNNMIYKTWAGGEMGRQVVERLFEEIPKILSINGSFYLLLLKQNNTDYVLGKFKEFGLKGRVVLERRIPGEYLYVLKFERS